MRPASRSIIAISNQTPIAIVGGGKFCKQLLELLLSDCFPGKKPEILGVADIDDQAVGIHYARQNGIYTTDDYRDLYRLKGLRVLIEITNNPKIASDISNTKPDGIQLIDQIKSRTLWSSLLIEAEKAKILQVVEQKKMSRADMVSLFTRFADNVGQLVQGRCERYETIERELNRNKKELDQIIEGNIIPTFVINQEHIVTHWNRACEKLTGFPAEKVIGTRDQWKPFRKKKRPTMADLVLDGINRKDALKYYGKKWNRSSLIDGAYEAEEFFPDLGEDGLWLFFTAAPIKGAEGQIIGAIETLQDRTSLKKAAEETIRQNKMLTAAQQEMAQVIEGSSVPTFVINKDHMVTHWNRAMEKLSGYKAEDIVGTNKQWVPFWKTERPSMADAILDKFSEEKIRSLYQGKWRQSSLTRGGYEAEMFLPNLGKNGKWCWFTAAPILDTNGKTVGVIETLWDKTEDKQAEEERKRRNHELQTLCSIYQTLGAPLDIDFRINLTIRQIAEILESDFLCIYLTGKDGLYHLKYNYGVCGNICRKMPIADKNSMIYKVAQKGRLSIFKNLDFSKNSELQMLNSENLKSVAYVPIFDREKNTFGIIRSGSRSVKKYTDAQKNLLELTGNRIGVAIENSILQEELKEKVYFQSKLIRSSNNGIVATDHTWKIVVFNPEAQELFGLRHQDVVDKIDARDIFPEEVIDSLLKDRPTARSLEDQPWEETAIRSNDQTLIPVMYSGALLYSGGKVMGSVVFFQDLREIKRLERELIHSEQLAAVGQTVAGMAHCIKNILNGYKGGSYLLNVGIDSNNFDKVKNGWEMIQRNIDRTSNLVMDLLSYSKEREPEFQWSQPNEIVADVMDVVAENAAEHAVTLVKDLSPAVGNMMLDERSVHRCLMNLVSNAIDACYFDDTAGKKYQVTIKTSIEDNVSLRLDVKDNGTGMDEEIKSRLFMSFFSTKGVKGTGLGLLVTRKLIEEHGGTIDVSSTPGKGTVFSIRIPIRQDDAND